MIEIRPSERDDWDAVWGVIAPVFRAGETYPILPEITKDDAFQAWVTAPTATYVATDGGRDILGTYYIKPNQPALGAHVCNCGYIVAEQVRGRGVASELCEHSQRAAMALGFRAMQFNLVVSTNESAVRLWQKLGFHIVGTLPGAFNYARLGYVDAHVMFKTLSE